MANEPRFELYPQVSGTTMGPDGEVLRTGGEQWRWRLRAGNGEIVATGESYTRKQDARRAIADLLNTLGVFSKTLSPAALREAEAALRGEGIDPSSMSGEEIAEAWKTEAAAEERPVLIIETKD